MEHFSVVQSIIRAGLQEDRIAFDKQVVRLKTRLEKTGASTEAAVIDRLLKSASDIKELAPSRVEVSRMLVSGEELPPSVNAPIDRETGAVLCEINFPAATLVEPVLGNEIGYSVDSMIEEWGKASKLSAVGVEPTRTILIYGPPGSGKTITAHHIAHRLGLPFLTARIDGLISSFLGTTARNIASLFSFANRYNCVLLLDEFDALAKLRDDPQEVGEIKRVVNTLLQNLDERLRFGITIGITNHDRLLDQAVWRRFESQIHIGSPDQGAREQLIERFLAPIQVSRPTKRVFAYCLGGQSGADIERTCMAVKRMVALSGSKFDGASLFNVLACVVARSPGHETEATRALASDPEAFISLLANDSSVGLKQTEIGEATGIGQSKVSEIKRQQKHLMLAEATPNA